MLSLSYYLVLSSKISRFKVKAKKCWILALLLQLEMHDTIKKYYADIFKLILADTNADIIYKDVF